MTIRRKIKKIISNEVLEIYREIRGTNFIQLKTPILKFKLNKLKNKVVTLIPKGKSFNRLICEVRYKKKKLIN